MAARKRTTELPKEGTVAITFRVDASIARELDEAAHHIAAAAAVPGLQIQRTELVRRFVIEGLQKMRPKKR